MFCASSVSYSDLLSELQRRHRMKHKWEEPAYVESLVFDLHMAQKCLQRAIYAQQVSAARRTGFTRPRKISSFPDRLQKQLDYPER